jgi:hypothetical protein
MGLPRHWGAQHREQQRSGEAPGVAFSARTRSGGPSGQQAGAAQAGIGSDDRRAR